MPAFVDPVVIRYSVSSSDSQPFPFLTYCVHNAYSCSSTSQGWRSRYKPLDDAPSLPIGQKSMNSAYGLSLPYLRIIAPKASLFAIPELTSRQSKNCFTFPSTWSKEICHASFHVTITHPSSTPYNLRSQLLSLVSRLRPSGHPHLPVAPWERASTVLARLLSETSQKVTRWLLPSMAACMTNFHRMNLWCPSIRQRLLINGT
jgi:hypothetical protein